LLCHEEKEVGHKPDKDGWIRYSQWIPGASDVGPDDEPRSYWERMLREEAGNAPKKAQPYKLPMKVTVDPSCDGIGAVHDPAVQRAALQALARSVHDENIGTQEHGFYASKKFGDGYSAGPLISSGHQGGISYERVSRAKPSLPESVWNGTHTPEIFIHTHPNNKPPSPASNHDGHAAQQLGVPVAAIDRAGNLTCIWKPRDSGSRK
jgi:hypothetical protein